MQREGFLSYTFHSDDTLPLTPVFETKEVKNATTKSTSKSMILLPSADEPPFLGAWTVLSNNSDVDGASFTSQDRLSKLHLCKQTQELDIKKLKLQL